MMHLSEICNFQKAIIENQLHLGHNAHLSETFIAIIAFELGCYHNKFNREASTRNHIFDEGPLSRIEIQVGLETVNLII